MTLLLTPPPPSSVTYYLNGPIGLEIVEMSFLKVLREREEKTMVALGVAQNIFGARRVSFMVRKKRNLKNKLQKRTFFFAFLP